MLDSAHMNDMDHYTGALLEHMDRKFDMILEMLAPIPPMQKDIADIKDRLGNVETDIKVMKAAITDVAVR